MYQRLVFSQNGFLPVTALQMLVFLRGVKRIG